MSNQQRDQDSRPGWSDHEPSADTSRSTDSASEKPQLRWYEHLSGPLMAFITVVTTVAALLAFFTGTESLPELVGQLRPEPTATVTPVPTQTLMPTTTPLPTATATIAPTPLPLAPAQDEEVLVIVTDFVSKEIEADARIFQALDARVRGSNLQNVRVEALFDEAPLNSEEAQAIGELYGATVVIWGLVDAAGITPHFEVIRDREGIATRPELRLVTEEDVPSYSAYITRDVPAEFEFLMLFSLGQIEFFSGNFEQAKQLFNEALSISIPDERLAEMQADAVFQYRARVNSEMGDLEAALADYTRAIELAPEAAAFNGRGTIHYKLDNLQAALADYAQAIQLSPDYALAYQNRGTAYHTLGDIQRALVDYHQAIELNPQHAMAYYNRGTAHLNLGDLESALSDYNRAIELDANLVKAYTNRGLVHYYLDELEMAIADYSHALDLYPEYALTYNNRGVVYHDLGDLELALADLNRALDLDPELVEAYDSRAAVYVDMGETEKAIADYERFIELWNGDSARIDEIRARIDSLQQEAP